jgi:hypothetical protein
VSDVAHESLVLNVFFKNTLCLGHINRYPQYPRNDGFIIVRVKLYLSILAKYLQYLMILIKIQLFQTFNLIGGLCCPTLDFVFAFWSIITFYTVLASLFCILSKYEHVTGLVYAKCKYILKGIRINTGSGAARSRDRCPTGVNTGYEEITP